MIHDTKMTYDMTISTSSKLQDQGGDDDGGADDSSSDASTVPPAPAQVFTVQSKSK